MMRRAHCLCLLALLFALALGAQPVAELSVSTHRAMDWLGFESGPPKDLAPPQIKQPLFMADNPDALLFEWSKPDANQADKLEYEFCLYELSDFGLQPRPKPLFCYLQSANRLIYDERFPALRAETDYVAVVNLRISNEMESSVLDGTSTALTFHYIPTCTAPRNFRAKAHGRNELVMTWEGRPAEQGGVRYLIQYRQTDRRETWAEVLVEQGLSLTLRGSFPRNSNDFRIKKLCDGTGKTATYESEWVGLKTANERIQLPPFTCGETYTPPPCNMNPDSCNWYDGLEVGDTLFIGGFPISVESFEVDTTDTDDPYYANIIGLIPLPFGNTAVRVEIGIGGLKPEKGINRSSYNWLCIDQNKNICSGSLAGMRANTCLPDLQPGPAAFGGAICVPPPSTPGFDENGIHSVTGLPWDENGFGQNGLYVRQPPYPGYDPGDPIDSLYDPNGFNAQGMHFQTGTPYGPNGCSRLGFNEAGQPCDPNAGHPPYYWLQDPNDTEAGAAYAEQVEDSLGIYIVQILQQWKTAYADSIAQQNAACNGIRTVMNGCITQLNYDRTLIFGTGDVYFNPGMWRRFSSEPQPLNGTYTRSEQQVLLEEKHIELYHCDKKADALITFKHQVDSLLSAQPGSIAALRAVILPLIRSLDADDLARFQSDINLFKQWLRTNLKPEVSALCDGFCSVSPKRSKGGSTEPASPLRRSSNYSPPDISSDSWSNLAISLDGSADMEALLQSFEITKEDIEFQFKQGFQEINGVERIWYLEAIDRERERAARSMSTTCDSFLMPIEVLSRGSDGRRYEVWLDNIMFYPDIAVLDAYILITAPNSGQQIAFQALGVEFNPHGPLVNPLKLELANDVSLRLNNNARLVLKGGTGHTFVAFDCEGFGGIGIQAEVEVCRNIVKPVDENLTSVLPEPDRVHGHVAVFLPTLDEFYAEITIDPFVITGIEDFKWRLDTAIVDFSSILSPNLPPPPGYTSGYASPSSFSPLWTGFYLKNLSVRFPNHFNRNNTPIQVGVQQVVIDGCGVSGQVYVNPVLSLDDGNAGGWAFSVDSFKLTVLHNVPVDAGFRGRIHIPILSKSSEDCSSSGGGGNNGNDNGNDRPTNESGFESERGGACNAGAPVADDCLIYSAFIQPGGSSPIYNFTVNTAGQCFCINMLKAGKVTIFPNSAIKMEIKDGEFKAVATLHGRLTINGSLSAKTSVETSEITFQGFEISNKAPYFSPGVWSNPSSFGAKIGNFGLTISNIALIKNPDDGKPALAFSTRISFVNNGVLSISAAGKFRIIGTLVEFNGRQRWVYDNWKIDEALIAGHCPGVDTLVGFVSFFEEDSVFGSGWRGGIYLKVKSIAGVAAVAQFGHIKTGDGYKYFFIDALACLEHGIPIFPGIELRGMGGGVFYHMTRSTPIGGTFILPACSGDPTVTPTLGQSLSGIIYVPTTSTSLGIKVTVALASPGDGKAYNGSATFEIEFNPNYSLKEIRFQGNARFMESVIINRPPDHAVPTDAAMAAMLDIKYDFNNRVLDANLKVMVNVGGVLRGSQAGNIYCNAKAYFSPNLWFVKMGTPIARNGLTIHIPNIGEIASVQSYIMIGQQLEPASGLPVEIQNLLNNAEGGTLDSNLPVSSRGTEVTTGDGFAFGMDIKIGTKEFTVPPLYASFSAQVGFDISLLDYGNGAVCQETGQPFGINGWYASGQVYAGIWGEMGIRVKVFGKKKNFHLFNLAAAATLQAKFPNPFWAQGRVGGQFSVLNGLVKGKAHFKVVFGEKCTIVGGDDPDADLKIIQEITPENGAINVAPNTQPAVLFAYPMGKKFTINEVNEGADIYYMPKLDEVKMFYRGYDIGVDYTWGLNNQSITIHPEWMFPGNDTMRVYVKIHVDSSGVNIHTEEKWATFVTGPGLNHIPPSNVKGSYPFDGQFNFYRKEIPNGKGYIVLDRAQPDLFWKNEYNYFVRFKQSGASSVCEVPLSDYKNFDDKVEFDLPAEIFTPNKLYRMEVMRRNPSHYQNPVPAGGGANNRMPGAECGLPEKEADLLYTAYFRVSQYERFYDKIKYWDEHKSNISQGDLEVLNQASIEPFGDDELSRERIDMQANLLNNNWFYGSQGINDLIYSWSCDPQIYYPGICVASGGDRESDPIGIPPFKAINIIRPNILSNLKIKKTDWLAGAFQQVQPSYIGINYKVIAKTFDDYNLVRENIERHVEYHSSNDFPCMGSICQSECASGVLEGFYCNESYPTPPNGSYRVIVRYRMPGYNAWYSSTYEITVSK